MPGKQWRIRATRPSGATAIRRRRCWKKTSTPTDPTYAKIEDGQWLNDEVPYGTIHRLASAGDRRGVASEVIAWCLEHCESLRADTHADNKIMQHLLEKNGFVRCGIIHVEDGTPRVAYQKLSATVHMQEE